MASGLARPRGVAPEERQAEVASQRKATHAPFEARGAAILPALLGIEDRAFAGPPVCGEVEAEDVEAADLAAAQRSRAGRAIGVVRLAGLRDDLDDATRRVASLDRDGDDRAARAAVVVERDPAAREGGGDIRMDARHASDAGEEKDEGAATDHRADCRRAALVVVLACAGMPACAEVPPFYALGPHPAQDILAAGVLFFRAPRYAGGEEIRTLVTPSGTAILSNGLFADPLSGIGYNASADPRFEYGVRVTIGLGREEPAALRGLGKIRNRPDVGTFANYNVTERFSLQSAIRYGSGYDARGMLADVGASYDIFQRGPVSVTLDASASFANRAYMRSFYGVSDAQARGSGFAPYDPRAAMQWHTAGVSLTTPVHPKALAVVALESTRLGSVAATSPYVTRRGSWALEATVSYAF